jgi:spermidine/putrescine transport system permease protein
MLNASRTQAGFHIGDTVTCHLLERALIVTLMIESLQTNLTAEVHFGQRMSRGGHVLRSAVTSGPAVLWLMVFLFAPLLVVGGISFFSRGAYGEIELPLTLDTYKRLLGFGELGFDPLYPVILLRSLMLGALTALFCAIAGLPLAFFIARLPARFKTVALTLVVIPFWTNLLIRTYAWQILFAPESWLTQIAHALGLGGGRTAAPAHSPCSLEWSVISCPSPVLPLYASVEKIDWTLAEAAMDLGANRAQSVSATR